MTGSIFQELEENWLFRVRKPHDFTARDITDLAFLYMVTLHILRSEFETAPFAMKYARMTNAHSNFKSMDRLNTDLYQFLNILSDTSGPVAMQLANKAANDVLWDELKFNPTAVKQFLYNITSAKYDTNAQKRLLLQLENQLHITVSNYRSMRRVAVEWNGPLIYSEAQRLVITRMLQALRAKARRGDVLPTLEKLASNNRYELTNVCNPETGDGCEPVSGATPEPKPNKTGFWKPLALGALAGTAIAYAMKDKKHETK